MTSLGLGQAVTLMVLGDVIVIDVSRGLFEVDLIVGRICEVFGATWIAWF